MSEGLRLLLSEGRSRGLGGKQLSVGAVCGVDEGVDALTVGAGGDTCGVGNSLLLGLGAGLLPELLLLRLGLELLSGGGPGLLRLGPELGSVNITLEVTVSRVSGVNEGVKVSSGLLLLHRSRSELLLLLRHRSGLGLLLRDRSWLLLSGGGGLLRQVLTSGLGNSWVKGGTLEASGSLGDVSALEDSKAVLTGAVPHSDRLAVLVDVAVLPDPFAVRGGLLPEHGPVLLGEGCPESAVSGIKSLLFEDFGIFGVKGLATRSGGNTRSNKHFEHDGYCSSVSVLAWLNRMTDSR